MYVAIIGDLVGSRKMNQPTRNKVHKALKSALEDINQEYASDIAASFLITLGDEFQGLLKESEHLMEIIELIQMAMAEYPLRFGIGIGEMHTPIEKEAIGADGPAFHMARFALDQVKRSARRSEQPKTLIRVESQVIHPELINHLLTQLYYQTSNWTAKQRQIVWQMRQVSSQQELANQLNVSQPYINQVLQSTGYYTYRASTQAISKEIKRQLYG